MNLCGKKMKWVRTKLSSFNSHEYNEEAIIHPLLRTRIKEKKESPPEGLGEYFSYFYETSFFTSKSAWIPFPSCGHGYNVARRNQSK